MTPKQAIDAYYERTLEDAIKGCVYRNEGLPTKADFIAACKAGELSKDEIEASEYALRKMRQIIEDLIDSGIM